MQAMSNSVTCRAMFTCSNLGQHLLKIEVKTFVRIQHKIWHQLLASEVEFIHSCFFFSFSCRKPGGVILSAWSADLIKFLIFDERCVFTVIFFPQKFWMEIDPRGCVSMSEEGYSYTQTKETQSPKHTFDDCCLVKKIEQPFSSYIR